MQAMGHPVNTTNGSVGGFEAIFFQRDPTLPEPRQPRSKQGGRDDDDDHDGGSSKGEAPLNGVYRSGSDHRKDGHTVGW